MAEKYKSILTDDMKHCYICGAMACKTPHHIFNAANKTKSEEYGLMMPICFDCHYKIHNVPGKMTETKQFGQRIFEQHYPELDFRAVFGKNYL